MAGKDADKMAMASEEAPLQAKTNEEISEDALFDTLMETIGSDGLFQKRLNAAFNAVLLTIMSMAFMNVILVMSVPGHHCHVPGRDPLNYTLEKWHNLTLPKEIDTNTGLESPSSCKLFAVNNTSKNETTSCTAGWDYDKTWYVSTIPSDNDWVCDRELYVTWTFVVLRIGENIGAFVFGQLGDTIGRKPVYYISLAMLVGSRIALVFTSHIYYVFLGAILVGGMATSCLFQTPLVISMEVSAEHQRAQIAFIQCIAWVAGSATLPLLQWAVGDWKILVALTTLPSLLAYFVIPWMPESPRWLASRGRVEDTVKVLKYIAKVNKTEIPANTYSVLEKIASKKESVYGFASLFSSLRLAKNTLAIIVCWCVVSLSYFSLFLNISNMAGNPFMNFFWQALVELPGYVIGQYLSNKLGRRWTHAASYVVVVGLCTLIIATHGLAPWLTTTLTSGIKFSVTVAFYLVWLQAMEIYPTCVRQSGTSIGNLIANFVGTLGPYIVYLGTTIDARLPYVVLLSLAVLGALVAVTLPETLHQKLPETLQDAREFGRRQVFWSFNIKAQKVPS